MTSTSTYTLSLLHVLLAHLNQDYIRYMIRKDFLSVSPSTIFDLSGSVDCVSCRTFKSQALSKIAHKTSLRRPANDGSTTLSDIPVDLLSTDDISTITQEPLFRVHIDGFEFHFTNSVKCFYIFTDEGTDFKMVYFVSDKSAESFLTTVQTFHAFAYYHHRTNIKTIRMDNGPEMSSEIFYDYARFNTIHLQRCAPYQHHQNGVAERAVRTCEETALTLLHHAHLSVPLFITYAVSNAIQIRNKCLTSRTRSRDKSPYELFIGTKPKLEEIHVIGQVCFSYILKDQRRFKYHPKARQCIYLCDDYERKAMLLMDVDNRSVITSRDVRFPRKGASIILPGMFSPLSALGRVPQSTDSTLSTDESLEQFDSSTGDEVGSSSCGDVGPPDSAQNDSILAQSDTSQQFGITRPGTPPLHVTTEFWNTLYSDDSHDGVSRNTFFPRFCETDSETDSDVEGDNVAGSNGLNDVSEVHQDATVLGESSSATVEHGHSDFIVEPPTTSEPGRLSLHDDYTHSPESSSSITSGEPDSIHPVSLGGRLKFTNSRYFNDEFVNVVSLPLTPKSYSQAVKSPQCDKWKEAMDKELKSLHDQGTWRLVPFTKGMVTVRSKWIFKLKLNENGAIERYKARLVAVGFTQTHGVDYDETYSPVLHSVTRRLLFSLIADPQTISIQADVETAFLQSELDHKIYLLPPPGLEVDKNVVLELLRAIYGLKQSPLLWYLTLSKFLLTLGFESCISDMCLFTLSNDMGYLILCLYVDDLILSSKSSLLIDWVLLKLRDRFPIRDVKKLTWTVGICVRTDDNGSMRVSQSAFILSLVNKYLNEETRWKSSIPMATDFLMSAQLESEPLGSNAVKDYQALIGSLNYLCHASRPDIMFSVNTLSRFLKKPKSVHWSAALRVVKYLNSTPCLSIVFSMPAGDTIVTLHAFCDASFASTPVVDGYSITGILIYVNGNLVQWRSSKQSVISLSAMEAELNAISQTIIDLQFIVNLLNELKYEVPTMLIYTDSEPSIKYLNNQSDVLKPRTRHLALKYHFIRKAIQDGEIELRYIPTKEQRADVLTKPLARPQFEWLRSLLLKDDEERHV